CNKPQTGNPPATKRSLVAFRKARHLAELKFRVVLAGNRSLTIKHLYVEVLAKSGAKRSHKRKQDCRIAAIQRHAIDDADFHRRDSTSLAPGRITKAPGLEVRSSSVAARHPP